MLDKVSIVIPVYNVEVYLKECIESVLQQSYTNLEIILVDDGATDSSGKICDEYKDKDNRVIVIHKENGGLSSARNSGLAIATGEFVYFLDSDDYIEKNAIEVLVENMRTNNSEVVFLDGNIFYEEGAEIRLTNTYIRQRKYELCNGKEQLRKLIETGEYRTAVPFLFFKKEFLDNYQLRFKEGIIHEDELFTILVFMTDVMVSHCNFPLYNYRIRQNSIMTASKNIKSYESMLVVFYELVKLYGKGNYTGEVAEQYMIRTSKTLMGRYLCIPAEERKKCKPSYKEFKKTVMKYKGFGNQKLKIKCSNNVMSYLYRIEAKLKNRV